MNIGVYICHCGINIAATVDVEKVTEYARNLSNVKVARNYQYLCSEPGQQLIKKDIKELKLDRVVVASCSPRLHEPTFRNAVQEGGLNPYCFEMANIREHCSWVHEAREKATEKAFAIIKGAVAKVALLQPLKEEALPVIPKALVLGGGIAGIQASLDLASAGFKVYLVEKSPSLGGRMAQLDKTFPTLDCSACILTPKMVEVGRNENIELLTYAELLELQGYVGNFKVKVLKKPKFVDWSKCNGCGECIKYCPVKLKNEFDLGLSERKAIYVPFPQAVPLKYTIEKKGLAPCVNACPANVNVQGYLALLSEGKLKEALELIRENNPFPSVCGRVCHHPCEQECNRKELEEPLAIRALKRFVADNYQAKEPSLPEKSRKEKIAVIGAGPSGLTCALYLCKLGYKVKLFDRASKPGGMLTACLPDYRLPKEIAEKDINYILDHGIKFETLKEIDLKVLEKNYDAIYLAIGLQLPAKLKLEGSEAKGTLYGLEFLREVKSGKKLSHFGKKIVVIGGGNVAIDCARTAIRLGADSVELVCLEKRALDSWDRMPAHDWEIEAAEAEGIIIRDSLGPKRIVTSNNKVIGLETVVCTSVYDDKKNFKPKFDFQKSAPKIDCDTIIIAIGQRAELRGFEELANSKGLIEVNKSLQTKRTKIFAGGDIVRGPASIVEAVADGKFAAENIERFLSNKKLVEKEKPAHIVKITELDIESIQKKARISIPELKPSLRKTNFNEVELSLSSELAIEEAKRCLNCASCSLCRECEKACEPRAILHEQEPEVLELEVGTIIVATGYDLFDAVLKPEFGYEKYQEVITALELERLCSSSGPTGGEIIVGKKKPRKVIFVQCVGSRDKQLGNEYCSRVCCMYTAKQALLIKEKLPNCEVIVCYTDVRAFGKGYEEFYDKVRSKGIIYRRSSIGEIYRKGNTLIVRGEDTLTNELYEEETDLVVLATALMPKKESKKLASLLRIPIGSDGFFLEYHPKLAPIDTIMQGIFLAGCAQSPKDIPDTVAQAKASASSALVLLERGEVKIQPFYAVVDEKLCSGCRLCESLCNYSALEYNKEKKIIEINNVLCQGCGSCSSGCPSSAIQTNNFTDSQLLLQLKALVE
jgi:heterodisulfide reductase subunit A